MAPASHHAKAPRPPRLAAGIDIGGTGLKVGLLEFTAQPRLVAVDVLEGHAREAPAEALDRLVGAAYALLEGQGIDPARLEVVGVGCAGLVDVPNGILRTSPNLPTWHDVPVRAELGKRLSRTVRLVNDAQAFLAAEWRHGAAQGAANAIFLTLGTGVGGGLVLNGKPYRGASGLGAEIGHLSVDLDGPPCSCGNRGCLELFVGRAAIERQAVEAGLDDERGISPARLADRAREGDARARRIFEETGRRLGVAIAGLVNLFEPEVVVVGGGVAAAGDLLLGPAEREFRERSMVARQRPVQLKPAALGPQAGMVGAALLAADPGSAG